MMQLIRVFMFSYKMMMIKTN